MTLRQKRILVTGALGMIGRALAPRLAAAQAAVFGTDLAKGPGSLALEGYRGGDLRDRDFARRLVEDWGIEEIVHCGGISGRAVSRDDPHGTVSINALGTLNLAEAARMGGVRVILCSSGSVYGVSEAAVVREDQAPTPVNSYGASKVAAEAVLTAYAAQFGVPSAMLRVFQVYGPGRRTRCFLKAMIMSAVDGRQAVIDLHPQARLHYIHIDDVVSSILRALEAPPRPAAICNISSCEGAAIEDVAGTVRQLLPEARIAFRPSTPDNEYRLNRVDISKAERELGFAPAVSLEDGILRYHRHLLEASA